jgi:ABC-type multidrug transport system ATPase subunit
MINTNNLNKKQGDFTALDQLELKVNEDEIYCLFGAKGLVKQSL